VRDTPILQKDARGLLVSYDGVIKDITATKQAEEALRESEERYRAVADFTYDWEYWMALDGKFVYVSPSCERITGYRPEEFTLDPNLLITIIHADDRDKIIEHLAIGEKLNTEHGILEFRIITRKGEERWIGHECQPVYNTNGNYLGRRGSNRDITGRKQTEEAVRHLTEFQESIITNALVWLSVLDPAGKILVWNAAAAKISGYRAEEVLGNNEIWKKLYPKKEYRDQVTTTINRNIREKKYLENFETVIRTKEGYEKIISWNTKGIPDATGKRSDYIVIGMDVTDRHRAEEQLNKTVDELKKFNKLTVDRELRMIALKQEINALLKKAGEQEKYRNGP
jgi:PAS domain S-box-containing protein